MTITPKNLSGSTSGAAIVVTATSSSGTLIHQAVNVAGNMDNIHLTVSNNTTSSVTGTLEWGTTAVANNQVIVVPPKGIQSIPFAFLSGNEVLTMYATSVSALAVSGRVYTEGP